MRTHIRTIVVLALGGYGFGTKGPLNQNVVYALAAKTVPVLGRVSAGYYTGKKDVLVAENNQFMRRAVDSVIVGARCGSIALLYENLVIRQLL